MNRTLARALGISPPRRVRSYAAPEAPDRPPEPARPVSTGRIVRSRRHGRMRALMPTPWALQISAAASFFGAMLWEAYAPEHLRGGPQGGVMLTKITDVLAILIFAGGNFQDAEAAALKAASTTARAAERTVIDHPSDDRTAVAAAVRDLAP